MTTTPSTARCLRCGRTLTSAASLSHGYGPACRARIRRAATHTALAGYKPEQRDKALEVLADNGVVPTRHPGVYRVANTHGDGTYLTHQNACNCSAGLRSVRCYHRAAVTIVQASLTRAA